MLNLGITHDSLEKIVEIRIKIIKFTVEDKPFNSTIPGFDYHLDTYNDTNLQRVIHFPLCGILLYYFMIIAVLLLSE